MNDTRDEKLHDRYVGTELDEKPQHMKALDKANEVRDGRAAMRREMKEGTLSFSDALDHPMAQTMGIADLIMYQHGWGDSRTRKFLKSLLISEIRKVSTLTLREKSFIRDRLVVAPDPPANDPKAHRDGMLEQERALRLSRRPAAPLASLIKKSGWSKRKLMDFSGLSERTIYAITSDERAEVNYDTADRICTALGTYVDSVYDGDWLNSA